MLMPWIRTAWMTRVIVRPNATSTDATRSIAFACESERVLGSDRRLRLPWLGRLPARPLRILPISLVGTPGIELGIIDLTMAVQAGQWVVSNVPGYRELGARLEWIIHDDGRMLLNNDHRRTLFRCNADPGSEKLLKRATLVIVQGFDLPLKALREPISQLRLSPLLFPFASVLLPLSWLDPLTPTSSFSNGQSADAPM